jgi:hypothetical protein
MALTEFQKGRVRSRIDLLVVALQTKQVEVDNTPHSSNRQFELNNIGAKVAAYVQGVEPYLTSHGTVFEAIMQDVQNACLDYEAAINSI